MTATATTNQKKTEIVTKSVKKNPQKNTSKGSGRSRAAQNSQTTGEEQEVRPNEEHKSARVVSQILKSAIAALHATFETKTLTSPLTNQ
jgi:hypothetical protein